MDCFWQADLVDIILSLIKNDGYSYLLTVTDVFSKFAFFVAFKKKMPYVLPKHSKAFLLEDGNYSSCNRIRVANFVSEIFQKQLKNLNVYFHTTLNDDIKSSVVERFNRILKTKIRKYYTHCNTYKFIDVLQDMVHSYNYTHQ